MCLSTKYIFKTLLVFHKCHSSLMVRAVRFWSKSPRFKSWRWQENFFPFFMNFYKIKCFKLEHPVLDLNRKYRYQYQYWKYRYQFQYRNQVICKLYGTNVLNNAGKVWSKFYLTQFTKNYHLAIYRDNLNSVVDSLNFLLELLGLRGKVCFADNQTKVYHLFQDLWKMPKSPKRAKVKKNAMKVW